jgi:hypothetical protein
MVVTHHTRDECLRSGLEQDPSALLHRPSVHKAEVLGEPPLNLDEQVLVQHAGPVPKADFMKG